MTAIRAFFNLNQPIIQFAYGLSFFIMGLAIALQSRRSSRLALARSLVWLAYFGILHGLYQWAELFSPVQEAYLTVRGITYLHDFHILLLSVSFACLFEFGVTLLQSLGRYPWLDKVTLGLLAGYAIYALLVLPHFLTDLHQWHETAEALARYTIGFPGALLAAYALREQTYLQIAPLKAPSIVATLRTGGIALAFYAGFGGLIPPPVAFFPGNWLNTDSFEAWFGLPSLVPQSIIGLILMVTIMRALEVFDVEMERRIEQMEQQQIMTAERQRLARELHDRTIQTAYTAGLLVDSARKLADPSSPIAPRLDKAVSALDEVILDLRQNLGELHTVPSGQSLQAALQDLAGDLRLRSLVDIDIQLELPESENITPVQVEHIRAIAHEALANVIRHAHARHVDILARQSDNQLQLSIHDDGEGLPPDNQAGYGLRHMQERARLLGGELEISSDKGRGTTVQLEMPWKEPA